MYRFLLLLLSFLWVGSLSLAYTAPCNVQVSAVVTASSHCAKSHISMAECLVDQAAHTVEIAVADGTWVYDTRPTPALFTAVDFSTLTVRHFAQPPPLAPLTISQRVRI